jgi:hypothetical protein
LETKTNAPVLWYGDVDFGDYRSAVSNGELSREISFRFVVQGLIRTRNLHGRRIRRRGGPVYEESGEVSITYSVAAGEEGTTSMAHVSVEIEDDGIAATIISNHSNAEVAIYINGKTNFQWLNGYRIYSWSSNIFSAPIVVAKSKTQFAPENHIAPLETIAHDNIVTILRDNISKTVGEKTIAREAWRIVSLSTSSVEAITSLEKGASTKSFRNFYASLASVSSKKIALDLLDVQRVTRVFALLDDFENELSQLFKSVQYLGPARVRSERYYRKQELQISEISQDGHNLPMFLASLSHSQIKPI